MIGNDQQVRVRGNVATSENLRLEPRIEDRALGAAEERTPQALERTGKQGSIGLGKFRIRRHRDARRGIAVGGELLQIVHCAKIAQLLGSDVAPEMLAD